MVDVYGIRAVLFLGPALYIINAWNGMADVGPTLSGDWPNKRQAVMDKRRARPISSFGHLIVGFLRHILAGLSLFVYLYCTTVRARLLDRLAALPGGLSG